MMKIDFNREEMDNLVFSLISRRNAVLSLMKVSSLTATYTRELEVVERLLDRLQPGSVEIIRKMESAA